MTEHGMIIKDNHVYTDTLGFPGKARKHNGLVVYRRMLEGEIPYINENNIAVSYTHLRAHETR